MLCMHWLDALYALTRSFAYMYFLIHTCIQNVCRASNHFIHPRPPFSALPCRNWLDALHTCMQSFSSMHAEHLFNACRASSQWNQRSLFFKTHTGLAHAHHIDPALTLQKRIRGHNWWATIATTHCYALPINEANTSQTHQPKFPKKMTNKSKPF